MSKTFFLLMYILNLVLKVLTTNTPLVQHKNITSILNDILMCNFTLFALIMNNIKQQNLASGARQPSSCYFTYDMSKCVPSNKDCMAVY